MDRVTRQLLNNLRVDFEMLRDGTWVPDEDSIDMSIDVIDELLRRLDDGSCGDVSRLGESP